MAGDDARDLRRRRALPRDVLGAVPRRLLRRRRRADRRGRRLLAARPRRRRDERLRPPHLDDRGRVGARRPPKRRRGGGLRPLGRADRPGDRRLRDAQGRRRGLASRCSRSCATTSRVKIGAIAKPANIVFTPELPKTRSGKIMRRLLRDVAEHRPLGDTTTLADPAVVREIADRAAETADRGLTRGVEPQRAARTRRPCARRRPSSSASPRPRSGSRPGPSQVVPLIHASPLGLHRREASRVVASSSKRTSTWLSTTSFSTSHAGPRGEPRRRSGAPRAQQRSTSSATPRRPSGRSAA